MWRGDRRYPGEEILVDPEGTVHRLRPVVASPKKWKIKYSPQSHQTKAASSPDKIKVDFHTDATYSDRIPKRVSIIDDSNRNDFLKQEKYKRQRKEDELFKKEVEDMRAVKQLRMLQDSYRRRGIVI